MSAISQIPKKIIIKEVKPGGGPGGTQIKFDYFGFKLAPLRIHGTHSPHLNTFSVIFVYPDDEYYNEFVGNCGTDAYVCGEDGKTKHSTKVFTTKLKPCPVYDKPGGEKIGEIDPKTEVHFVDVQEVEDKEYLRIKYGKLEGFFDIFSRRIAEGMIECKKPIPYLKENNLNTVEDIMKKMKVMVRWPVDRETNEPIPVDEKNRPISFVNCKWYKNTGDWKTKVTIPHKDKNKYKFLSKEELCGTIVEDLYKIDPQKYRTSGITFIGAPQIGLNGAYCDKSKGIIPQWHINGSVVTQIVPKGDFTLMEQQEDIQNMINDENAMSELQKQMEEAGIPANENNGKENSSNHPKQTSKINDKDAETGIIEKVDNIDQFLDGSTEDIQGMEGVDDL